MITINCDEVWKDATGYEDYYQVSSLGRVKSKDRIRRGRYGQNPLKGKILKPTLNNRYYRVVLCVQGHAKMFTVHRLVALTFISNPEGKHEVNHIDCNRLNNSVCNLEWCTRSENMRHAHKNNLIKYKPHRIPVVGTNILTGEVLEFTSMLQAAKSVGCHPGNISNCFRGVQRMSGGYIWKKVTQVESNYASN